MLLERYEKMHYPLFFVYFVTLLTLVIHLFHTPFTYFTGTLCLLALPELVVPYLRGSKPNIDDHFSSLMGVFMLMWCTWILFFPMLLVIFSQDILMLIVALVICAVWWTYPIMLFAVVGILAKTFLFPFFFTCDLLVMIFTVLRVAQLWLLLHVAYRLYA